MVYDYHQNHTKKICVIRKKYNSRPPKNMMKIHQALKIISSQH